MSRRSQRSQSESSWLRGCGGRRERACGKREGGCGRRRERGCGVRKEGGCARSVDVERERQEEEGGGVRTSSPS